MTEQDKYTPEVRAAAALEMAQKALREGNLEAMNTFIDIAAQAVLTMVSRSKNEPAQFLTKAIKRKRHKKNN